MLHVKTQQAIVHRKKSHERVTGDTDKQTADNSLGPFA